MISKDEAKTLSDSALDTAYAQSKTPGDVALYSVEILNRLSSVRSFITGSLGIVRFPKYNLGKDSFKQTEEALTLGKVGDSLSGIAGGIGGGIGGGVWKIALPILVVVVVIYVVSKKI